LNSLTTHIEGLFIVEPKVFGDERGFFTETYNQIAFSELGINQDFVQDNWSRSRKGVLRGLHFQDPNPQGKLVRCFSGTVYDVAVDLRTHSATFGEHYGVELSSENKLALWIPPGFAHGFLVLSDMADFFYKCTAFYSPHNEHSIHWNDVDLKIKWPMSDVQVSAKDQKAQTFKEWRENTKL
jgi:dTDP-4-dehydrorhamnose 3,5-epimerase